MKMIWGDPFAEPEEIAPIGEEQALTEERAEGYDANRSALDEQLSKGQIAAMRNSSAEKPREGSVRSYIQRRNGRKIVISGYERARTTTKEQKPE